MSASLVGSEMCIRDRAVPRALAAIPRYRVCVAFALPSAARGRGATMDGDTRDDVDVGGGGGYAAASQQQQHRRRTGRADDDDDELEEG
eukprot:3255264-Alexandrium_andersonii.AAC.1